MIFPTQLRPLLAAGLLAALAPAASAAGADATVPISHFRFAANVTVPAGASVTWKNLDGEPHTVTSTDGLFRSPALDQGESFTFRFSRPGVYAYLCSIHPQMRATVTVR